MTDMRVAHLMEMGWTETKSGNWIDPEPEADTVVPIVYSTEQAIAIQHRRDIEFVERDDQVWAV